MMRHKDTEKRKMTLGRNMRHRVGLLDRVGLGDIQKIGSCELRWGDRKKILIAERIGRV